MKQQKAEKSQCVDRTWQSSDLVLRGQSKSLSFHWRHLNAWPGWTLCGGHWYHYRKALHFWTGVKVVYMGCPNPEIVQRSVGMSSNLSGYVSSVSQLHGTASLPFHQFPLFHLLPVSWKLIYIPCWQVFLLHRFDYNCTFLVSVFKQSHVLFHFYISNCWW